jgi:hypothetical protein
MRLNVLAQRHEIPQERPSTDFSNPDAATNEKGAGMISRRPFSFSLQSVRQARRCADVEALDFEIFLDAALGGLAAEAGLLDAAKRRNLCRIAPVLRPSCRTPAPRRHATSASGSRCRNRPRGSSHGVLELLGHVRETVPAIADEFTGFKVLRKAGRGKIPNRMGIIARVSLPRPQPPLVWALFKRR